VAHMGLLAMLLLWGCATTIQNPILPTPLKKGEDVTYVGFTVPFNKFNNISLAFNYYRGVKDDVVIGFSLPNLIMGPVYISKYYGNEEKRYNVNLVINDLTGIAWNPMFQLGAGVKEDNTGYAYSSIGYFTPNLWRLLHDNGYENGFDFELGVRTNIEKNIFAIQYNSGITNRIIKGSKKYGTKNDFDLVISRNEEIRYEGRGYTVVRNDSLDDIVISMRDPYADCIGCWLKYKRYSEYSLGESYYIGLKKKTNKSVYGYEVVGLYDLYIDTLQTMFKNGGVYKIKGMTSERIKETIETKSIINDFNIGYLRGP